MEREASAITLPFNSLIFFGSWRASSRKILPLTILIALLQILICPTSADLMNFFWKPKPG